MLWTQAWWDLTYPKGPTNIPPPQGWCIPNYTNEKYRNPQHQAIESQKKNKTERGKHSSASSTSHRLA